MGLLFYLVGFACVLFGVCFIFILGIIMFVCWRLFCCLPGLFLFFVRDRCCCFIGRLCFYNISYLSWLRFVYGCYLSCYVCRCLFIDCCYVILVYLDLFFSLFGPVC